MEKGKVERGYMGAFIQDVDEKLAKYYNNIELLGNKNKKEKDELTKKIDEIGKILKEPIDETIFTCKHELIEKINNSYTSLINSNGWGGNCSFLILNEDFIKLAINDIG